MCRSAKGNLFNETRYFAPHREPSRWKLTKFADMFAMLEPEEQVHLYLFVEDGVKRVVHTEAHTMLLWEQTQQGCKEPAIFMEPARQLELILRTLRLWMPWLKLLLFLRDPGEHILSARYMDSLKVPALLFSTTDARYVSLTR